jgi:hypothetical protein
MAVAQAPVPQASVSPAPRSHTRRVMASRAVTVATLTLMRSGKSGSCSISGPRRSSSTPCVSGVKKITCGLPTLTAVGAFSSSQPTGMVSVSMA